MKNSLFGIIFLEPDRLTLRIVELPTLKIITEVQSGALIVGSHNVANYAQNMQAIVGMMLNKTDVINDDIKMMTDEMNKFIEEHVSLDCGCCKRKLM